MAELIKLGSQADMLYTPKAGYVTKTLALNESGDVVELVKKSDGSIVSVGGGSGSGSSDGYVVVEDGGVLKAQKLAFDGTTASDDGSPENIENVGIFNTGMNEPEYKGSTIIKGTSAFYKCASVDSTAKTWTGYEAIVNGDTGVWSFSEEVTSGLSYSKIIPQVGKVYNEECTFMVSGFDTGLLIPSDGLVFYAPLSTDYIDIVNGYDASEKNGTFAEYNGKKMLQGDGTADVLAKWNGQSNAFLPVDTAPCSIFAVRLVNNLGENRLFGFGAFSSQLFCERVYGYTFYTFTPSENTYRQDNGHNVLKSVCITRDSDGNVTVYEDGNVSGNFVDTAQYKNDEIFVGVKRNTPFNGYISDFAIYNRALTADEVLSMHNNLMPQ